MKKLLIAFIITLIATLIAELSMYPEKRLGIAGIPFFHALIGFFSCFAIVFIAKIVGFFLKRKEEIETC